MLLGIIEPDGGTRQLLGAAHPRDASDRVGYLPEERGLYPAMKAREAIAFLGALRGLDWKVGRTRAAELLEANGLGHAADTRIRKLSKGMAQLVQLLGSVVHRPDFIVLDEPFSGLDPVNQERLEALIRAERDRGATVLFSTHVMAHAQRLCDRLTVIAKGRARFEGTVDEARGTLPQQVRYVPHHPDEAIAVQLPADAIRDGGGWRFAAPARGDRGLALAADLGRLRHLRPLDRASRSPRSLCPHRRGRGGEQVSRPPPQPAPDADDRAPRLHRHRLHPDLPPVPVRAADHGLVRRDRRARRGERLRARPGAPAHRRRGCARAAAGHPRCRRAPAFAVPRRGGAARSPPPPAGRRSRRARHRARLDRRRGACRPARSPTNRVRCGRKPAPPTISPPSPRSRFAPTASARARSAPRPSARSHAPARLRPAATNRPSSPCSGSSS